MSLPARKNLGGCYQSALVLLGVILFLSAAVEGAEWAAGSNAANQTGIYGAKGVASTENVPGARRESASWVDAAGNFWLFGGWNGVGYLNDLWKFDGTNWTWMSGSMYTGQTGVYGTPGSAASENIPGARGAAVGWVDRNGNFWLFGGAGYAPGGTWAVLDDLWKFDGTNWTLVNGSTSVARQAGVYGTLGVAAAENMPGARYGGVSWADRAGNLWLFGGWGYDSLRNAGWLNDLWKFDGTYWTWVSGANIINQPGAYGTQGQSAPENTPGSRWGSVSWVDSKGNLWLFGGVGNWGMNFNDLWKFDGTDWTWVSGAPVVNQIGIYGTQDEASAENVPGARDHGVGWVDANDNLWLFGGWSTLGFFDDVWKFDGSNWTWVDGPAGSSAAGINEIAQIAGSNEWPSARWADAAWVDADGNLWLFGGWNTSGYFNDLWNLGSYRSTGLVAASP